MNTETRVREVVEGILDPHTGQSLGDEKVVRGIGVDGAAVAVEIRLGYPAAGWHDTLAAEVRTAVGAVPGVGQVTVSVTSAGSAERRSGWISRSMPASTPTGCRRT